MKASEMKTKDFYQAVWPGTGIYCVSEGLHRNKEGAMVPHSHGFTTIQEAADYSQSIKRQVNVWFAVHTLV